MYAAIWRALPGPWWVRTLIVVFFLTLLGIACVMFIFPWVDQTFFAPADPLIDPGIGSDPSAPGDGGGTVDGGDGGIVGGEGTDDRSDEGGLAG